MSIFFSLFPLFPKFEKIYSRERIRPSFSSPFPSHIMGCSQSGKTYERVPIHNEYVLYLYYSPKDFYKGSEASSTYYRNAELSSFIIAYDIANRCEKYIDIGPYPLIKLHNTSCIIRRDYYGYAIDKFPTTIITIYDTFDGDFTKINDIKYNIEIKYDQELSRIIYTEKGVKTKAPNLTEEKEEKENPPDYSEKNISDKDIKKV